MINAELEERLRPQAEAWGLSPQAAVLAAWFVDAVRRRSLPYLARREHAAHWERLRSAARTWHESEEGRAFTWAAYRLWGFAEEVLTPEVEKFIERTHPADLVAAREKNQRLTRSHVWIEPHLGFPETHHLLFFCWNVWHKDALREAGNYYIRALSGHMINSALMQAIVEDDVTSGLFMRSLDPRRESDAVRLIQSGLNSVGRQRRPSFMSDDQWDEVRGDSLNDYIVKELPKAEKMKHEALIEAALRGRVASRYGYDRDLLNQVKKACRRHEILRQDVNASESLDSLRLENLCRSGSFSWIPSGRPSRYGELGIALRKGSPRIRQLLGRRGPDVLRARISDPGITDKEIAEHLGCHISTIERVNAESRKCERELRQLIRGLF